MQQVVFDIPVKTFMGSDVLGRIGQEAAAAGSRALIVTGTNVFDSGFPRRVENVLSAAGVSSIIFSSIGPDTTSEAADEARRLALSGKAQMIVGIGGVKTLSIARTAALTAASDMSTADFLDGSKPSGTPLPFFSVPTTCRDPFMFRDSVMLTDGRSRSCRLRSTYGFYPSAVFIDPDAAASIPSSTFTFSLMETFMYAVEGYMSGKGNFLSENLFLKAISAVVTSDQRLGENTADREAFIKAARAGLVTAMGGSMAGPGIGAAVSMVIAARFRVPRVLAAAVVLPLSLEHCLSFCPEKVARLAPILDEKVEGLSTVSAAERVIEAIRHRIGLKRVQMRLSEFGVKLDDLGGIAETARKFEFMSQLPAPVTVEDLIAMLRKAL